MRKEFYIRIAAFVIGASCGPYLFPLAKASQPPLSWGDTAIVFAGSTIGSFLMIGLQVIRRNPMFGRVALALFSPIALFVLGLGVGAFASGVIDGKVGPSAVFFGAAGIGVVLGVQFAGMLYRARFSSPK